MRDVHAFAQRWAEAFCKAIQIVYDLLPENETIRIRAFIVPAGQAALPVRRNQTKTVPAVVAPAFELPVALEHDMLDPLLHQIPTDGKTGLAASDDENWDVWYGVVGHNKPFHGIERQVTLASAG